MKEYHIKGDTTAIYYNNYSMTFPKLFKEIDKVAAGFYKLGIRKGDVVIISLPNIPQSIVAVYAASRIGAIASMVHPKVSANEFAKIVESQQPKAVLLSDINFLKFSYKVKQSRVILCPFLSYSYLGLPLAKKFEPYNGNGDEPMFYMQSGGTSGDPKTVVQTSKSYNAMAYNLLNYLDDKFSEKTLMLTMLPMFHCFGMGAGVHVPLCANMGIVLMPKFDAQNATKLIAKFGVTCMLAVPRMISKFLKCKDFSGSNIKTLEEVFVGGDIVSAKLKHSFNLPMVLNNQKARLYPGYGLTESSICLLSKDDAPDTSVGKPLLNVDYLIVDDMLEPVIPGEVGELLLSSDQIMDSYLNDEESTERTIVTINGKKYLRTGDFFKADCNGFLYCEGRKKRLIKISGMNVFPNEIEKTAKELLFINECVAIEYFKDNKNFVRLLVEGDINLEQKDMAIKHITKKLSHWSTPNDIVCVNHFPRTNIGKIDIERLKNEYQKD